MTQGCPKVRPRANVNHVVRSTVQEPLVREGKRFAGEFNRGDLLWLPIHDGLVLHVPDNLVEAALIQGRQSRDIRLDDRCRGGAVPQRHAGNG